MGIVIRVLVPARTGFILQRPGGHGQLPAALAAFPLFLGGRRGRQALCPPGEGRACFRGKLGDCCFRVNLCTLFCSLCHWYCCYYYSFPCPIAVSGKLFLSQSKTFTFCASISPLLLKKGRERMSSPWFQWER